MPTRATGANPAGAGKRGRTRGVPIGDPTRLDALSRSGLGAMQDDARLAGLARLAALTARAPTAAVSLVSAEEQTFVASYGLRPGVPVRMPVSHSLCRHVVETGRPLSVVDGRADPALRDHPAFGTYGIRAYLGVPLTTSAGLVLGAFCLVDRRARAWTKGDEAALIEFARAVMDEAGRRIGEPARPTAADALEASGSVGIWAWREGEEGIVLDPIAASLCGAQAGRPVAAAELLSLIHPDDRGRAAAMTGAMPEGGACREEVRILRADGTTRWVEVRGRRVRSDGGLLAGTVADIDRPKAEAQRQEDLSAEIGHRMKNLMATVQAIVFQTLRESDDMGAAATAVSERMAALGRSHDLVLSKGWGSAGLAETVELVAGYFGRSRFDVTGPELDLPPRVALALSMALHELATNAVKYGALTVPEGRVRVAWRVEEGERLVLDWRELRGPAVARPTRKGLGTRLLDRVLSAEMHGETRMLFEPEGLRCRIAGDLGAIRREAALAAGRS